MSLQNVQQIKKLSIAKISSHLPDTSRQPFWMSVCAPGLGRHAPGGTHFQGLAENAEAGSHFGPG